MENSRRRRKRQLAIRLTGAAFLCVVVIGTGIGLSHRSQHYGASQGEYSEGEEWIGAPKIHVDLLDVSEYSRPGIKLEKVKGIVIHYVANPGSGAKANRDYFQGLKDTHTTSASSHFIVGLDGEIIQCIPSSEISYASNDRNVDTLSIECCHEDDTGKFNENTYQSMVDLTGWLCYRFHLSKNDVIRHYDVSGKICPKYFVEHEEEWERFKQDVDEKIQQIADMHM